MTTMQTVRRWIAMGCLAVLGIAGASAQQVLDFGPHGRATIYLLGDWKATVIKMPDKYELKLAPKRDGINAECSIAVTFPEVDRFETKARLKLRVEADAKQFEEMSVEGKAYGREFVLRAGTGFYCNFTDPRWRAKGEKPPPGEFKVISVGKIKLAPNVLMDVAIMADSFTEEPYQQLLGAIEGMEFTPGRGR
jgi:hypothetical protein